MKLSNRTRLAALLIAGTLVYAGGCKTRTRAPSLDLEPAPVRLSEAYRLGVEAQKAQKAGDLDRAMALYQESLQYSQDLHAVWNNMGLILVEQQNYIDAVEMFRVAADLAPYDPQPFYNIGQVYDKAGHPQRAMEYYERSLERDPRYLPSLRGFVLSAKLLDMAEPAMIARIRTALMVERDPKWRMFHERELLRMESALRDRRNSLRPQTSGQ